MERFPWQKALALLALFALISLLFQNTSQEQVAAGAQQISYSAFKEALRNRNISEVVISENEITGTLLQEQVQPGRAAPIKSFRTDLPPMEDPELMELMEKSGVEIKINRQSGETYWWVMLANSLPWLLLIGFWIWTMRRAQGAGRMGPFGNFGQANAKMFDESVPKVTFQSVAGMKNQKLELEEIVDFLKAPEKYKKIGGRVPKGIMLVGPPGTGKTLLAKAVAGEAGAPFYSTSASEFIEMFVGVGAARVRDLFKKAREKAPSIIFIDEIDAVGRSRGAGLGGGHDEREQTLNQLLGELDGFEGHERVIVLAATNRPDALDSALLRPGRFDRQVVIDLPTMEDRTDILRIHTKGIPLEDDVDLGVIARSTPGMSGADLENLANEAALFAARDSASRVTMRHIDLAKDKVLMGVERPGLTNEMERKITAYHEAGHTVVAKLIDGMDPVHKVTIMPRGQALGVTQLIPEDDRHYYPKAYLMGKLAVNMGGRAAELLIFNDTSTGAQSDLKQSTDLAEKMVCQWGMSDKLGPVTFSRGEEHVFLGKKIAQDKTYSEEMAWLIDQEIEQILRGAERNSTAILKNNLDALEKIAFALLEHEELTGAEVDDILAKHGNGAPPEVEVAEEG